jgi:hypothetical protein
LNGDDIIIFMNSQGRRLLGHVERLGDNAVQMMMLKGTQYSERRKDNTGSDG